MRLNIKNQVGSTLIEIIMVVAMVALFTIGVLNYYNSAKESSNVEQTISGLTSLTSVVRNQFTIQGDFQGLTEAVVYNFANLPVTMKGSTSGVLVHPWDKSAAAITMTTAAPYDTFTINLVGLADNICADIASKTFRHFDQVSVGGATITNVPTANTACTGGTNTLAFRVR